MRLRDRAITLKIEKPKPEDGDGEPRDPRSFEEKVDFLLEVGGRVAIWGTLFVFGYVLLDTHRQVSVAKASHN